MKTLSRCRNKMESDNVVLIDVDTYDMHNVIVVDIPESILKKHRVSSDKNRPSKTYIFIDDDESPCANDADGRNFDNGASSSRRYESENNNNNNTPVKLSKAKRTYSGRGFNAHIDSDESDDDDLDCEFMEDFSGKVREEWEKASLKRKGVVHNDQASCSRLYKDVDSEFEVDEIKQKHAEASKVNGTNDEIDEDDELFYCDTRDFDGGKDDLPSGEIPSTNNEEENEKNDASIDDDDEDKSNDFKNAATVCHDDENDNNDFENNEDAPVENSIIDQREKHKETDEYKRALEEELSARQKALQIQAEEAQHLRRLQKRKKAECLRLVDMERRQKQRVEEIRDLQKKDEENMNLKEQYRTEVRLELKRLEISCFDMASLLRGLGIQVGNNSVPLSHEVRAAYKRALLSFHPDRASGSDMRGQVEAEEKFKLISRMKEKFSI